jgi:integrase/recombinase XerD
MKKESLLGSWIKRFLLEYLITLRNLSRNTQLSYRDTFRLLLPFISRLAKKSIENLTIEDIKPKGHLDPQNLFSEHIAMEMLNLIH